MNQILRKFVLIVFAVIMLFTACTKKKPFTETRKPDDLRFSEYIAEYSFDVITRKSNIVIRLARSVDLSNSAVAGKDNALPENVLVVSPAIKGSVTWEDNRTIVLKPEVPLPSNKRYEAALNLSALFVVPDELAQFKWSFRTREQNFDVSIKEITFAEDKGKKVQQVTGLVETADWVEPELLEKVVAVKTDKPGIVLKWEHQENENKHHFRLEAIPREAKTYKIQVNWNGNALGVNKKGNQELEIYGLEEFHYISYRLYRSPSLYIEIQFSLAVDKKQDITGIIKVEGDHVPDILIENNIIKIFPTSEHQNTMEVSIKKELKDVSGTKLGKDVDFSITFEQEKPQVKWIKEKGGILPDTKGIVIPFQAISLRAVDVTIIEVFEDNIIQFLQVNKSLAGINELKRVGRPVLYKTIILDQVAKNLYQWNRYSLNLDDVVKLKPGSLYQVKINFRRSQSVYSCNESEEDILADEFLKDNWDSPGEAQQTSYWDYYDDYYAGDYWENRNNPCKDAYYGRNREIATNILASNLGILARGSEKGDMRVYVSNIVTTEPVAAVKVTVFNYQQQTLGEAKTDSQGYASFYLEAPPFALVAAYGKERGYLRLDNETALPLSGFDIGGTSAKKGIKGFVYGERGVWRPGDTLYLSFILEDKQNTLPVGHPVIFELRNPRGQLEKRVVETRGEHGIYAFPVATDPDAPTGNWEASVRVGGEVFTKILKIETVKPNRLKINLSFGKESISVEDPAIRANLAVQWLHGAIAQNLDAEFWLTLVPLRTAFKGYLDYVFDDPSREIYAINESIFSGSVDDRGKAAFNVSMPAAASNAPGLLNAVFTGKVYEEGGDFSIDKMSLPYYPFSGFVGIKLPPGDKARGMLLTDTDHKVPVVVVDSRGALLKGEREIEATLYKLSWRWWWDKSDENVANYLSGSYSSQVSRTIVSVHNGNGEYTLRINYPEWGRYLLRMHDRESGHATGKIFYIDWPGWAGSAQREGAGGATMLSFFTEKAEYQAGETVKVTIPGAADGRALVSLETGSKVVNSYWVKTVQGKNDFEFKATPEMAPNVYINIALVQPHAQVKNDLPVRLYGVFPIKVIDPATKLEPELNVPSELAPEKEVIIKVKEKSKRNMAYTLAVVDEGLLDLTRFDTPQPWDSFYAKEALGVKSWDLYDQIIGALGEDFAHLLTIGGGGDDLLPPKAQSTNRFEPVVKFFGPFYLEGGKEATHKFTMPRYIGAVKTMLVAANNGAYGSKGVSSFVKESLMVLGTMPRVLGPGEKIKLPVNVFVLDDKLKQVEVTVTAGGALTVTGQKKAQLKFDKAGDKFVYFDLQTPEVIGMARISIEAVSGKEKATYSLELEVRPSNPVETSVVSAIIEGGKTWNYEATLVGLKGTNKQTIELSYLPSINLEKRLSFLIQYPHGCIEQTTSSVFPQLYLDKLVNLGDKERAEIEKNVKAGIEQLKKFRAPDGGFAYWPGESVASEWGSCYAGHFLVEARNQGYSMPGSLLADWAVYQRKAANLWQDKGMETGYDLIQAYRLYTLALYGTPELGAMNRLKEKSNLDTTVRFRLAAAYALSGKKEAARDIILNLAYDIKDYKATSATYGSALRDKAMILETLALLDDLSSGLPLLKELAESLGSEQWYSTQTTAYTLLAVALYGGKGGAGDMVQCEYQLGSDKGVLSATKSVVKKELTVNTGKLTITNKQNKPVYVRFISQGIPLKGKELETENYLKMEVLYKTREGKPVYDLSTMKQGTDLVIETLITNPGVYGDLEELALTQIFPSGWEILNARLQDLENYQGYNKPEYMDIRDDRVYTYFDLQSGQTVRFGVIINAAYLGEYYMPGINCEAMYNNEIASRKKGKQLAIIK